MTALEPNLNPDLEFTVGEAAAALQLTASLYADAEQHYRAVSAFLSAVGSPLSGLNIDIYPQGSMAHETTVKPIGDREFDLDFVCQVDASDWSADHLYATVFNRLHSSDRYRPMLSMKKRCVSLKYADAFHLDIIPAIPDPNAESGGTNILIPDRVLSDWTASNPKGFSRWLRERTAVRVRKSLRAEAKVEPLPALTSFNEKEPLLIAVQLMKRIRDVMFGADEDAPRSIILTTIAGHHYRGEDSVLDSLENLGRAIVAFVHGSDHTIVNPSNPEERFSDGLTPLRIERLKQLGGRLITGIASLRSARGIDQLQKELLQLVGDRPATAAVVKYGELLSERRRRNNLTYAPRGLGVVTSVSNLHSKPHRFYGG